MKLLPQKATKFRVLIEKTASYMADDCVPSTTRSKALETSANIFQAYIYVALDQE